MKNKKVKYIKSFKTQIFPTEEQVKYFNKAFGIRRKVWNSCIDNFINNKKEFNENQYKKYLNRLVKIKKYAYLNSVNSMVRQEALVDFKLALDKYKKAQKFLKSKNKSDIDFCRPTKKDSCQSFRYNNKGNPFKVISKHYFRLTTTKANFGGIKIKCNESLLFLKSDNIRIATITILRDYWNKYYISVIYEITNHKKYTRHKLNKVGIDMGIKNPLTCITKVNKKYKYKIYKLPKKIKVLEGRIDYQTSKITKKVKGSNNYYKHKDKIQKLYDKLVNIRKEFTYQTINFLCKNFRNIYIEDFNFRFIKGKGKHNINRTMANIGKYRFLEHLKYKIQEYDNILLFIPKGTPTTQTCYKCGHTFKGKDKLTLKDREYKCPECNLRLDRDLNAAINIFNFKQ